MMVKTRSFDAAEFLNSPDAVAEYLARRAMKMPLIARAIGTAARAGSMAEVAREAGLSRENLYRSLNDLTGRLGLDTVPPVIDALGLKLEAKPKAA